MRGWLLFPALLVARRGLRQLAKSKTKKTEDKNRPQATGHRKAAISNQSTACRDLVWRLSLRSPPQKRLNLNLRPGSVSCAALARVKGVGLNGSCWVRTSVGASQFHFFCAAPARSSTLSSGISFLYCL